MKKEVTGFPLVLGYLGYFLFFIGLLNLIPLVIIAFYPSEWTCYKDFLIPGVLSILVGLLLSFFFIYKKPRARFTRNEDSALLVLIWLFAVLLGAMPFYVANLFGDMKMSFSESIFESTSAYATTGLSVFKDYVEVAGAYCPHVFCFHRSFMQFVGGVGLVLIVASVLRDRDNLKLYFAEGHNDKLLPSLGRSAKLIFGIYSGYTLLGTIAFYLAGMDFFDALNHAMCALSTAGFSTHSSSLAYYATSSGNGVFPSSPIAIEIIAIVLMLLGAISFVLHTFLFTGKFDKFAKDSEIKFSFFLLIFCAIIGFCSAANSLGWNNSSRAFRLSFFGLVSSMTTTGFSNCSIDEFLSLGKPMVLLSIILMTIGGGMGSTGGGIKQYRVWIDFKDLGWSLRYRFSSSRTLNPKTSMRYGEFRELDEGIETEAHNYTVLYLITLLGGTLLCCFLPSFSVEEATYEFASALSGTGLSIVDLLGYGATNPTAYPYMLWILSVGMFIGRLEILPIYYAGRNIFDEIAYYKKAKKDKDAPLARGE